MSAMQAEVFEAFRSIAVPEDKALKAAEALSRGAEVPEIKKDIAILKFDVAALKADMTLVKWMIGTLFPLVFAILLRVWWK
jgi:hypothetical protein